MRNYKLLKLALFFFVIAGVLVVLLINANAQTGTPPLWLTHKYFRWSDGLLEYYVTGYWWTDGPYWHKGDVRTFQVNFDVFSTILTPNYRGYISDRICIITYSTPYTRAADGYQCNPSFEQLLPIVQ